MKPLRPSWPLLLPICGAASVAAVFAWLAWGEPTALEPGMVLVSTADSPSRAQFAGDGRCDEKQINEAIASLPRSGGKVYLLSGTYDICAVEDTFGGIVIDRSNVTIQGQGPATNLRLSDNQNTNVIRLVGSIENIVIQDLRVDGNRDHNTDCERKHEPTVPTDGFECNGIKAHYLTTSDYLAGATDSSSKQIKRVWVRNVIAENAGSLNIMLSGNYVYVFDSFAGNARSDSIELLIGPGQISRTTVVVDAATRYGLSTDEASNVQLNDNLIHVTNTGTISQSAIRTWAGYMANQINDNLVWIEPEARVNRVLEMNTAGSTANDNLVRGASTSGWETQDDTTQGGNTFIE